MQSNEKRENKMFTEAPPGWTIWGNFGDGKWRASRHPQSNEITPQNSKEEAIQEAWKIFNRK
jgi:hypothetical protein